MEQVLQQFQLHTQEDKIYYSYRCCSVKASTEGDVSPTYAEGEVSSIYKAASSTLKASSPKTFKSARAPHVSSTPHHKLVTAAHRMLAKTSRQQQQHAKASSVSSPHVSGVHTKSATNSVVAPLIWDLPGKKTLKKKGLWLKKSKGEKFSKIAFTLKFAVRRSVSPDF